MLLEDVAEARALRIGGSSLEGLVTCCLSLARRARHLLSLSRSKGS